MGMVAIGLSTFVVILISDSFGPLGTLNAAVQFILFFFVACIPGWKTGRLSYVDIAWPWGLACIGACTLMVANGEPARVRVIGIIYLMIGLRMGLGALVLLKKGFLRRELPRYQYRHLKWREAGVQNIKLETQIEILKQCIANISFSALPAFIIASNPKETFSLLEYTGLVIALAALAFETIADVQKNNFLTAMKKTGKKNQVCNVGLWRYTRHPNYFGEWMVWNGLAIAAIPSWLYLKEIESMLIWVIFGAGLIYLSRGMYVFLVYQTGAEPAEYYSVQKRPDYAAYQQTTNQFFPGPPAQPNLKSHG